MAFCVEPCANLSLSSKNLADDTIYFKNSGLEDLYHLSLRAIMNSNEGIVIVPINFLSARNSKKIRD